jgi:hypothetical protein
MRKTIVQGRIMKLPVKTLLALSSLQLFFAGLRNVVHLLDGQVTGHMHAAAQTASAPGAFVAGYLTGTLIATGAQLLCAAGLLVLLLRRLRVRGENGGNPAQAR